jgi:hypothetical protein
MYAWLWRALPGPLPVRLLMAMLLVAVAVALCFTVLFPWLAVQLPLDEVTIGAAPEMPGNPGG